MTLLSKALDSGSESSVELANSLCTSLFRSYHREDPASLFSLSNLLAELYASHENDDASSSWDELFHQLQHNYNIIPKSSHLIPILQPLFVNVQRFRDYLVETFSQDFGQYLHYFHVDSGQLSADSESVDSIGAQELLVLWNLELLHHMYVHMPDFQAPQLLNIVYFLALEPNVPDKLNHLSLKILCEAVARPLDEDVVPKVWSAICTLTSPSSSVTGSTKAHVEGGYRLWLRWLSAPNLTSKQLFQEILGDELYWNRLHAAIVGPSQQCRKYALHILAQSLKAIDRDISVPSLTWFKASHDFELEEWSRYIALVEIVSIDTSFNQTQESLLDFTRILKPSSPIPGIWSVALLTLGLRSSSENIRKVIAGVVMDLSIEDMAILATHSQFAASTIYKYLMQASHFVTIQDAHYGYTCPHLARLCKFTCNLVVCASAIGGSGNHDCLDQLVLSLLQLMYDLRTTFDPARFAVFKGIAEGLEMARSQLGSGHLEVMKVLGTASSHAETDLREHGIVYYCLQIMKHFDFNPIDGDNISDSDRLASWVDVVGLFIQRVSYKLETQLDRLCIVLRGLNTQFAEARTKIKPDSIVAYVELLSHLGQYSAESFVQTLSIDEICFIILAPHQDRAVHNMALLGDFELRFKALVCGDSSQIERPLIARALMKKVFEYDWITELVSNCGSDAEPSLQQCAAVNAMSISDIISFLDNGEWIKLDSVSKIVSVTAAYRKLSLTIRPDSEDIGHGQVLASEFCTASVVEMIGANFSAVAHEGRVYMVTLFESLVSSASESQLRELAGVLAETIWEMWQALSIDRLMASERDLHKLMITSLFHKNLVRLDLPILFSVQHKISTQLVKQCYARRGILPLLAKQLSWFEGIRWVGEAMLFIYTFLQQDTHLFRLENVVASIIDSELASSKTDLSYFHFYGDEEVAARIVAADFLYNFAGSQAAHLIEQVCVSPSYRTFNLLKRNDGYEEIVRVRCFQAILLLEHQVQNESFIHQLMFTYLVPALHSEPSPLARVYIEWLVSRLVVRRPEWVSKCVFEPLSDCNLEPRLLAAALRIGLMICRALRKKALMDKYPTDRVIECCDRYLEATVALCTSNRSQVRHTAVSMICAVVNNVASDVQFREKLGATASIADRIAANAASTDSYRQYKSGEQTVWDIESDLNLLMICGGVLKKVSERPVSIIHLSDFIRYLPGRDLSGLTSAGAELRMLDRNVGDSMALHTEELPPPADPEQRLANIQTKSGAWSAVVEDTLDGQRRKDQTQTKPGHLVVLASLVDKAPNLGGLCRVCEVLGAKTLCVPDINIVSDNVFKTVAVTADQWMPMEQVAPSSLVEYMRDKKRQGYTLVGLEQTDNSQRLDGNFHFPEKTVLLLGKEREGIPATLLAELDLCVEIPQVGIIRSMNIQTAAAVAIHAYSSQYCSSSN